MSDFNYIPYYSLKPDCLTVFQRPEKMFFSDKQRESFSNLENNENRYNELSQHSRKRLQKSIDFMLYITKFKEVNGLKQVEKFIGTEIYTQKTHKYQRSINFKITFITLTLSAKQHNTDEKIKSGLLNIFLNDLRRRWGVTMYVWKAEKQQNGNIHFHILTNQYIKWQEIRERWNIIQNKSGFEYVNTYSRNMKKFFENGFKKFPGDKRHTKTQIIAYHENKKNGWTNPNSTDIHAIYKMRNIASYMSKYMAKDVTKTSRVNLMNSLYKQLDEIKIQRESLLDENCFLFKTDIAYINNENEISDLKLKHKEINSELNILKGQGISGRIWGQSQDLSKVKSFSQMEHFDNIPDIEIVKKIKRFYSEVEAGSNTIMSYYFNIEKTPNLKRKLDEHIENIFDPDYEPEPKIKPKEIIKTKPKPKKKPKPKQLKLL